MYAFHFIQAYSMVIAVVCLLLFLACIFFAKKYKVANYVAIFAGCLLFLSLGTSGISYLLRLKHSESELLSDATEGLVYTMESPPEDESFNWIWEAVLDDKATCLLVPSGYSFDEYVHEIFDLEKIRKDYPDLTTARYRVLWYDVARGSIDLQSKYSLTFAYTPHMKDDYHIPGAKVLSKGINSVLKGILHMQNAQWESARKCFQAADSSGNYTGTYYLSDWYKSGFGDYPRKEKADSLLEKAANGGCRTARVQLGKAILSNKNVSHFLIGKAEDYLLRVTTISTVACPTTVDCALSGLTSLNDYYKTTGRRRKAYRMTRKSYLSYGDMNVKYNEHLDNCLSSGRYKEALLIIKEGEAKGIENCYIAHALLLMHGWGLKKDRGEAERILRYAADSLDYYPAYHTLAWLYQLEKRAGASFYEELYNAEFSQNVHP